MARTTERSSSTKKPSTKKKSAPKAKKPNTRSVKTMTSPSSEAHREVSVDDRERMIQYAAYHIAERDGFRHGKEQDYWYQAEQQITELLKGQPGGSASH